MGNRRVRGSRGRLDRGAAATSPARRSDIRQNREAQYVISTRSRTAARDNRGQCRCTRKAPGPIHRARLRRGSGGRAQLCGTDEKPDRRSRASPSVPPVIWKTRLRRRDAEATKDHPGPRPGPYRGPHRHLATRRWPAPKALIDRSRAGRGMTRRSTPHPRPHTPSEQDFYGGARWNRSTDLSIIVHESGHLRPAITLKSSLLPAPLRAPGDAVAPVVHGGFGG